jgi:catechol 2,3-dioxygenase-like lactoylglutathione lyase family enzyme
MDPLSSLRPYSVTLSVSDADRAAKWYCEKLGFREAERKNYREFGTSLVFLELNGYSVELIKDARAERIPPRRPDPPKHTSTLGVSQFFLQTGPLAAVRAELIRRAVPILSELENAELGVLFLFIRDPDGNLIQFLQRLR